MKKLWLNTVPGKDINADHKFYFHQEVPKVINGYYKISKAEAVKLAALIYRGKCGEVATTPAMIQKQLQSLVPEDVIGQQKSDDWKKQILAAYNGSKGKTEADAMSMFLKIISQYPTFGSTFFVVKQTTDRNFEEVVFIAINRNGFNVVNATTKVIFFFKARIGAKN